jgi:hypothetical protein
LNELKKTLEYKEFNDRMRTIQINKRNKTKLGKIINVISLYWDVLLLLFLNLIFAATLILFLNEYFYESTQHDSMYIKHKFKLVKNWLIAQWMQYNDFTDLTKESCAFLLPEFFNPVLKKVDDCSMCLNVYKIERVEQITREDFLNKYAYTGVPLVIVGAVKNWSAMNTFNFEFLKELYTRKDLESNSKTHREKILKAIVKTKSKGNEKKDTCQFFPYKTKFKNLKEVFEKVERGENGEWKKPWYVGWSNCNNYASEILRQHYERPEFLPEESEMSRIDWIFMGTPGYGAHMHIDDVKNPSWQAQISGVKHWIFKPPAECMFKCITLETFVHPGDIIIFDSNRWFHATNIIGNDLSLTIGSEYD